MATYYLATTGSDAPGVPGTIGSPFLTFQYAVGSVLVAGDTLYVRGGTYTGAANVIDANRYTVPNGTNLGAGAVVIAGYPSETAILQPPDGYQGIRLSANAYVILQDLVVDGINGTVDGTQGSPDNVFVQQGTHHVQFVRVESKNSSNNGFATSSNNGSPHDVEFINCLSHDNGRLAVTNSGYGYYVSGVSIDVQITGGEVYNNNGYGIQVNGGPGTNALRTIVNGVRVHDNQVHGTVGSTGGSTSYGLVTMNSDGTIFRNNLVYTNQGGLLLYSGATNTQMVNNTVTGNVGHAGGGEYGVQMQYYGTGNRIANNIVYANANGAFQDDGGGSGPVTLDHNLTTDPLFVNAAVHNYHLQRGSAAINAGATIAAVPTDFDGLTRPQGFAYCIGAYEFQASTFFVAI